MPYHRSVDQPKSCSKAPWSFAWYEVDKVAAAGLGGVAPVAATVRSPCTTDLPRPHSCSITTSLEQCDGGETGWDGTERNGTGRDRTGRNREGAKMPSNGNRKEEEGDEEVIILCSTDVEQGVPGVRRNENSPKIRPVEQRVPPVLGALNVGRNASSHSIMSSPTYQTVPEVSALVGY
ncbi:unnamed protein product [Malus baccata var. baccata]